MKWEFIPFDRSLYHLLMGMLIILIVLLAIFVYFILANGIHVVYLIALLLPLILLWMMVSTYIEMSYTRNSYHKVFKEKINVLSQMIGDNLSKGKIQYRYHSFPARFPPLGGNIRVFTLGDKVVRVFLRRDDLDVTTDIYVTSFEGDQEGRLVAMDAIDSLSS